MLTFIKILFFSGFVVSTLVAPVVAAADDDDDDRPKLCFDFSTGVKKSLRTPIFSQTAEDIKESGSIPSSDAHWGSVRGRVDRPLADLVKVLLDHNSTKSPKVKEMKVEDLKDSKYLARHLVEFKIKPFPFVTVEWKEDWAYAVSEGTAANPQTVVVSYQKTEGTSHIKHLCGSTVLKKSGPTTTDVFIYEEVDASRRSPEDTTLGLMGTLATLRTFKK